MQLKHHQSPFSKRSFPCILICDQVTDALNIGGIMRTCDAFGIRELYLCGLDQPLSRKFKKTARSAERVISFQILPDALSLVQRLKQEKYSILCLEVTSSSNSIRDLKIDPDQKTVLVVGSEHFGIDKSILNLADRTIHIEMHGQNSSMNVVAATNIALYEIIGQYLKSD